MEVSGILKFIGETEDIGTSGFQKRDCVVTTEEQYPQHILVQFTQDKCNLLANYKIGDKVAIGINLRGREWINPQGETIYFNTIRGWKIANIQPAHHAQGAQPQQAAPAAPSFSASANNFNEDKPDDLPF
jgi:hypothetical protein